MKRQRTSGSILIFFFLLLNFWACQEKEVPVLRYSIQAVQDDSIPLLQVELSLPANPAGFTRLHYPNEAWGETDLHQSLKNVELSPPHSEARVEINKDSGWIDLHYRRNLPEIHVRYQIQQDFEQSQLSTAEVYRPIVQTEYFHLFAHHLFMAPSQQGEVRVELTWDRFPENYLIHNSFGSGDSIQRLEPMDWEEFQSSIFVGGDFRVQEDLLEGNRISLATRGRWIPFEEKEVFQVLKSTLKAQRDFWNDHSQTNFTVTLHPFEQEQGSSFQGTGLTNSFATSVSNNDFTDLQQLVYLFNHELMHNWIGHTIENENEEEQYWFSEGFTEYYTFKNIALNRVGGAEPESFLSSINEAVRNLYSSPVRDQPNSQLTYDNFWSNPDYGKLPYYRGAVFAFILDMQIKKESGGKFSLDNLMRDLLKRAREGERLGHSLFLEVLDEYWSGGESYFKKHILNGEFYDLEFWYKAFQLEYEPIGQVYELGFELSENRRTVTEVYPGTNAKRAGLKAGDKLFSRSIWYGSLNKKVELGVLRDGKRLEISFLPVKEVDLPQLEESPINSKRLGLE